MTDHAKQSKKGRLTLERDENGSWVTMQEGTGNSEKVLILFVNLNC